MPSGVSSLGVYTALGTGAHPLGDINGFAARGLVSCSRTPHCLQGGYSFRIFQGVGGTCHPEEASCARAPTEGASHQILSQMDFFPGLNNFVLPSKKQRRCRRRPWGAAALPSPGPSPASGCVLVSLPSSREASKGV